MIYITISFWFFIKTKYGFALLFCVHQSLFCHGKVKRTSLAVILWSTKHLLALLSSLGRSVLVPKRIREHSWHLENKHSQGQLWFQGGGDVIKLYYLRHIHQIVLFETYSTSNNSHQVLSTQRAKMGNST